MVELSRPRVGQLHRPKVFGGLLALRLTHTELTLVASVALILMVGTVMRYAMVVVDVALALQRGGASAQDASLSTALARARAILMTKLLAVPA